MMYVFHAVAIDHDGTLTEQSRPDADVVDAIREIRRAGKKCILVTGRILSELRSDFPDVDEHFDAIVAENGAVLCRAKSARELSQPVAAELETSLRQQGVHVRRGRVLLATEVVYDSIVNREIARLGLECHIVRNRNALMVLPGGVNKGSGLLHALAELRLSPHSTVGIGDAENDHSLLDACEIGVAVANAVPALKARAEIVLPEPAGRGVAAFLRGPFIEGAPGVEQQRWRMTLGTHDDGELLTIPASRVSVLIQGPSGGGKSWFLGSLVEQLIGMRYMLCVLDLEGDHIALGDLPGAMTMGGKGTLPDPADLSTLLGSGFTSVILDLSLTQETQKRNYARDVLQMLWEMQLRTGIPHWIIIDEAHAVMRRGTEGWWCRDEIQPAICAATYRPDLLCPHFVERSDFIITIEGGDRATLERRGVQGRKSFVPIGRTLPHVRHWHKYREGELPDDRRFVFRTQSGPTGQTAANLREFETAIRETPASSLAHHAANHDFSRWLRMLFHGSRLVGEVSELETRMAGSNGDIESLRDQLTRLLQQESTA